MKKSLRDSSLSAKQALGQLQGIQVQQRNAGGAAEQLTLTFAAGTVTISGQLFIRDVLGAMIPSVNLHNGEQVETAGRLPSAAIAVEGDGKGGFVIYGGGYGHGVGMSQNGAKDLAAIGFNYQDILLFFYKNTTITEIA
jgi:stage II sporulation protein D